MNEDETAKELNTAVDSILLSGASADDVLASISNVITNGDDSCSMSSGWNYTWEPSYTYSGAGSNMSEVN